MYYNVWKYSTTITIYNYTLFVYIFIDVYYVLHFLASLPVTPKDPSGGEMAMWSSAECLLNNYVNLYLELKSKVRPYNPS